MRKDCGYVGDLQLLAKDLLTLGDTLNERPANSEAERLLLAAESLRANGRLRLRVRGESMLPSLWPGDEVEIVSCAVDDARKGDVVLSIRDGRFFLHRFVGQLPGGFLLRGDSMPAPDPEFSSEALLGRLSPGVPLRWWSRAVGMLLCFCGPARRVALELHGQTAVRKQECSCYTIRSHMVSSAQQIPETPHGRV